MIGLDHKLTNNYTSICQFDDFFSQLELKILMDFSFFLGHFDP